MSIFDIQNCHITRKKLCLSTLLIILGYIVLAQNGNYEVYLPSLNKVYHANKSVVHLEKGLKYRYYVSLYDVTDDTTVESYYSNTRQNAIEYCGNFVNIEVVNGHINICCDPSNNVCFTIGSLVGAPYSEKIRYSSVLAYENKKITADKTSIIPNDDGSISVKMEGDLKIQDINSTPYQDPVFREICICGTLTNVSLFGACYMVTCVPEDRNCVIINVPD